MGISEDLKEYIKYEYLQPNKPTVAYVYYKVVEYCQIKEIMAPSQTTVYSFIRKLEDTQPDLVCLAREGEKAYTAKNNAALDERQLEEAKKWLNYMRFERGVKIPAIARETGYQSYSMILLFSLGKLEPVQELRVAQRIMLLKEVISEEDINKMKRESCPAFDQSFSINCV